MPISKVIAIKEKKSKQRFGVSASGTHSNEHFSISYKLSFAKLVRSFKHTRLKNESYKAKLKQKSWRRNNGWNEGKNG